MTVADLIRVFESDTNLAPMLKEPALVSLTHRRGHEELSKEELQKILIFCRSMDQVLTAELRALAEYEAALRVQKTRIEE